MKKTRLVLFMVLVISSIICIGCTKDDLLNVFKNKEFSSQIGLSSLKDGDEEEFTLFCFEVDEKFKSLLISIELYQNGEMIEKKDIVNTDMFESKGQIGISINTELDSIWDICLKSSDKSFYTYEGPDLVTGGKRILTIDEGIEILPNEEITILAYVEEHTEMSDNLTISELLDDFSEYKHVYLLKCKFSNTK